MKRPMVTDQLDAAFQKYRCELIEPAATLYAAQKVYGDNVREQSKPAYGRLLDAHLLITGVLGAALLRVNGKITPIRGASDERSALFASYVIGMEACERAIEEGRYLQAHALLRQEMETVAQLKAVAAGRRKPRQSPNVATLEKSLARLYGDLSDAAHVSSPEIVRAATNLEMDPENLPGPTSGTRYFPVFIEALARRSFALHLMLTLRLLEEMSIDFNDQHGDDGFTKQDVDAVDLAVKLMVAEGVLEVGGEDDPP